MSLPVHVVESLADARVGDEVGVEGAEAHHAVAVRRLRVGEQVVLTDGRGRSVIGAVASTGKSRLAVTVASVRDDPEPAPSLTVVQALAKGERGERAVEVLTEVGVATIVPWAAARSVVVWQGERAARSLSRWQAGAREAAKQARRTWHPVVTPLADLAEVTRRVAVADLALVLHEDAVSTLAGLDVPGSGAVLLVVGPEGGLTTEELDAFAAAGAHVVRLGSEVLRTSTAGVVAAAAILSRTSRWT